MTRGLSSIRQCCNPLVKSLVVNTGRAQWSAEEQSAWIGSKADTPEPSRPHKAIKNWWPGQARPAEANRRPNSYAAWLQCCKEKLHAVVCRAIISSIIHHSFAHRPLRTVPMQSGQLQDAPTIGALALLQRTAPPEASSTPYLTYLYLLGRYVS